MGGGIEQRKLAENGARIAQENESKATEYAAKAAKNYEMARRAVRQMLTRVADEQLVKTPETKEVRRRLLKDATLFYTELLQLNPEDVNVPRCGESTKDCRCSMKHVPITTMRSTLGRRIADFHRALAHLYVNCPDVAKRDLRHAVVTHVEEALRLRPEITHATMILG